MRSEEEKNTHFTFLLSSCEGILLGPLLPLDNVQGWPTRGRVFSELMPNLARRRHTHIRTHTRARTLGRKEKSRARRMKSEDVITGLPVNGDKPSAAALKKALTLLRPPLSLPPSLSFPSCLFLLSIPLYAPPTPPPTLLHVSGPKYKRASVPACCLRSSTGPRFPHDAVMLAAEALCASNKTF